MSNEIEKDIPLPEGSHMGRPTAYGAVEGKEEPKAEKPKDERKKKS